MIDIRPVSRDTAAELLRMREALWPSRPGQHAGEIEKFFTGELHAPHSAARVR